MSNVPIRVNGPCRELRGEGEHMKQPLEDVEARLSNEATFHDARINTPDEDRLGYVYASVADVYEFCAVPRNCQAAAVLEVGCFRGDQALRLEDFAGSYTGIDISPAAIEHCRKLGLPSNMEFRVDDANAFATIEDASVDYAFGNGVLHHLDLSRFAPALARKLSPQGYARFIEPAQGSLPLRVFRKLTPQLRTPDEYPFDRAAIALLQRYFSVRIAYKALLRPWVPMIFLNNHTATRVSSWIDNRILQYPILQSQAWLLQVELGQLREA